MTRLDDKRKPAADEGHAARSGHGHWMMIACCRGAEEATITSRLARSERGGGAVSTR